MKFPPFAKAIAAAILTGAAPSVAAATSPAGVTSTSTVESIVGAAAAALVTYWVPNGTSVKDKASGLVVTLKTDAHTFLSTVLAGLPGLVQNAMQAALKPATPTSNQADAKLEVQADAPTPAAPTDAATPVVDPAILGKA